MSDHVAIVLNGTAPSPQLLRTVRSQVQLLLAADGAYGACLQAELLPDALIGDLDSRPPDTSIPATVELVHDPDQNHTDFQKCLQYLTVRGIAPRQITILGGFGGRTDHWLTNLSIAAGVDPAVRITFLTDAEQAFRVTSMTPLTLTLPPGTTLSLLPFPAASGLRTKGLRWNLSSEEFSLPQHFSQSNEIAVTPCTIEISSGCIYVIVEFPPYAR